MSLEPRAIIGFLWIAFALYWFIAGALVKPVLRRQSIASRAVQGSGTIAGFVLIFYTRLQLGPLEQQVLPASNVLDFVGLAFTIAGLAFAVWARVYLGGNWSGTVTIKQDHTLIRTGPYGFVRHPIYTGILFAALGGAISGGKIRSFLGFVLLVVVLRLKSLLEEQYMQEQFGGQYTSYKHDVKALVPFIW
jgi:protein-S-isoprenylcysteine O-methyltransferase Ste14